MNTLIEILVSTILVSLISLIGIATFLLKEKNLKKIIEYLVAFSIGGLIGGAFFDLIPESLNELKSETVFIYLIIGIFIFFAIEKYFHWRHCHEQHCEEHSFAYSNLVGGAVHNFFDGISIAAAFLINFNVGIATTFAIVLHEIPHELGDFGVLMYAGFKKEKAIFFNLLTAFFSIIGGIIGFVLLSQISAIIPFVIALTAGGFIYISVSDLIPEIRKEVSMKKSLIHIVMIFLGILLLYLFR
ncbi:Zinc transporter ZupT [uncultured archaeon]|nr:Zinc transporter ZupT [uncultured archaeon]